MDCGLLQRGISNWMVQDKHRPFGEPTRDWSGVVTEPSVVSRPALATSSNSLAGSSDSFVSRGVSTTSTHPNVLGPCYRIYRFAHSNTGLGRHHVHQLTALFVGVFCCRVLCVLCCRQPRSQQRRQQRRKRARGHPADPCSYGSTGTTQ